MTDIRPGIYKIGNLQIIMFSDEIIGVGFVGANFQEKDQRRIKEEVRLHFPKAKTIIIGEGPVSYKDLLSDVDFRKAVETIVSEGISSALGRLK